MKNAKQRENFTNELLHQLKELHSIKNNIRFSRGVVYNAAKVGIPLTYILSFMNYHKETGAHLSMGVCQFVIGK